MSIKEWDVRIATQFSGNWIIEACLKTENVSKGVGLVKYGSFYALDNFRMLGGQAETGNH